jgi:hypothetical protein
MALTACYTKPSGLYLSVPDFSRDVERRVRFANDIREPDSPKNDQKICWYCRHKCE